MVRNRSSWIWKEESEIFAPGLVLFFRLFFCFVFFVFDTVYAVDEYFTFIEFAIQSTTSWSLKIMTVVGLI